MKKTLLSILLLAAAIGTYAQSPQMMNYQGVARSSSGAPIASHAIGLRLTIHDGSASGTVVYQETQSATTNAFGLYNLLIGSGAATTGTFTGIAWGSGDKYLQVEMDPGGGTGYTDMGTTQLASVPYAQYSNNAMNADTITGPLNMGGDVTGPYHAANVVKLRGKAVSGTAPTTGQVLQWSGTQWSPASLPNDTVAGTANYLAKFTSSSGVGNSLLYDNGTSLALNTTSPSNMGLLTISGVGTYSVSPIYQAAIIIDADSSSTANGSGVYAEGGWRGLYGHNYGIYSGAAAMGVEGNVEGGSSYTTGYGVYGKAVGTGPTNYGVYGTASGGTTQSIGVYGTGTTYAGYFSGEIYASSASSSVKAFKIDDPRDPGNKYLYHSSVESNDMMNVYNGNIVTDANGDATVELPAYFSVLNKDYKYQLTCIGQFAQAIVAEEVSGNHFKIKTDKPNVKVSWMITGVRQDPVANAHRIQVEVEKPASEKGKYLAPELYGYGKDKEVGAAPITTGEGNKMQAH